MKSIGTFKWDGQFKLQGACNATACCCPASDLAIEKRANVLHAALQIDGHDCTAGSGAKNFTVKDGNNANTVGSLGTFTPRGDNALNVLLNQVLVTTDSGNSCTVTMNRVQSSITSATSNPNRNNTSTAKNHVSSNYDSTFIKFISIIMAITVVMHI
ncbi:unnamed protein product [Rotaria sp. Silwood1]|nr:unnamed protein product [Rotaria sp. Silwood1]